MRPGPMQAIRIALAALVVSSGTATAARAQVIVSAERDLQFGLLTPGTATTVLPTDLARSAQLRIEGRGTYQISVQLPASLTALNGQQVPLQFGPTSGRIAIRNRILTFDPGTTFSFRMNPSEPEALVNLGGVALPATGQTAGSYTATIVLMVVQTGT